MEVILSKYALVIQKIYWFAYVQLLWLLFTLLGLIILGIFPATLALIRVFKAGELSSSEAFKLFKQVYLNSFLKMNGIGALFSICMAIVSLNLYLHDLMFVKMIVFMMIGLLYLMLMHIIQVFECDKAINKQVKKAFQLLWVLPKSNIGYMLVGIGFLLASTMIPGIVCFFGISIFGYVIVKIGHSEEMKQMMLRLQGQYILYISKEDSN